MKGAYVHEIFVSIQGEGPRIGQRQIFVRFQGCDIRCRYCDTPAAGPQAVGEVDEQYCTVQDRPGLSGEQQRVLNPLSADKLSAFCKRLVIPGPARPVLSLTGGEPLLQAEFLARWLPDVKENFLIYLETSGIHDQAMKAVAGLVDVVSMDFKLPSATGLRPFWNEHREFLVACRGRELFVKAVVTGETKKEDVLMSARIIAGVDASLPLILQPAGAAFAPSAALLVDLQDEALRILADVRVIPQAHKILAVP